MSSSFCFYPNLACSPGSSVLLHSSKLDEGINFDDVNRLGSSRQSLPVDYNLFQFLTLTIKTHLAILSILSYTKQILDDSCRDKANSDTEIFILKKISFKFAFKKVCVYNVAFSGLGENMLQTCLLGL